MAKKKEIIKTLGGIVVVVLIVVAGIAVLQYQLNKPVTGNDTNNTANTTNTVIDTVEDTVYVPFTYGDIEFQRPKDYFVKVLATNGLGQILFEDKKAYVKLELRISKATTTLENYIYLDTPRTKFSTLAGQKAAVFVNESGYADGPTQLTTTVPFIAYSTIHNGKVYDLVFNEATVVGGRRIHILDTFKFIQ
jgi:hypothetical protein